jgi:predicted phosphate transport protein (TIGR00153 family)
MPPHSADGNFEVTEVSFAGRKENPHVRLIPKDEGFFDLFDGLALRLTASATHLHNLFSEPTRLNEHATKIKELEHEADEITHEIMLRLDRSFVTPLDREDIHALATNLDNVVDLMDGTARRAQMFHITDRRDPAKALSAILVKATESIKEAVSKVKQPKEVARIAREIKILEEQGDTIYGTGVGALFEGTPEALDVIKWKELYDHLENALDECEDCLNVLESVSIKNS